MLQNRKLTFVFTLALSAALLLSACTRQSTTEVVGTGGGGDATQLPAGGDTTLQPADLTGTASDFTAINATLIAGNTATAEALLGQGPKTVDTPVPGTTQQAIQLPTATAAIVAPTAAPTATPTPAKPTSYTVKPGDWLYQIARNLGVSPADLIAANPQINPNAVLQPGTVLNVPGSAPAGTGGGASGGKTYTVKLGDNLFRIALNNGTTYQTLAQLNNLPAPYTLYPGQVLKLP